jgi:hypothetical protein
MRWAAVIIVVALGAIALAQAYELAVARRDKGSWVLSLATCWGQNVAYRSQLPADGGGDH